MSILKVNDFWRSGEKYIATSQANYFIKQGATSQLQLRLGIVVDNTLPVLAI